MVREVVVFGQDLLRLARRLDMPGISIVEGHTPNHPVFAHSIAAVVFDCQILPLDGKRFRRLRLRAGLPLVAVVRSYDEAELALRSGCCDTIVKPITAEELNLRIQRALWLPELQRISVGGLVIEPATRRVTRGTDVIRLRPLEFRLLCHLAANVGRVVSYDELLNEVWGYDYDDGSHLAVKAAIKRLRQQIEPHPSAPKYILNVAKVGYMLAVEEE